MAAPLSSQPLGSGSPAYFWRTVELQAIFKQLAKIRPVFHSEADLQHALAWQIHRSLTSAKMRLELPFSDRHLTRYLDLLVRLDGKTHAIEIKYKTRRAVVQVGEEVFRLKDQGAQDLGRYDFFRDLQRIEALCQENPRWSGWVLFLTNDSSYWKPPARSNVAYEDFRMEDGRLVTGVLDWGPTAGPGTTSGRAEPISLSRSYRLNRQDYSSFKIGRYSQFRYVGLAVGDD